jgi:hypothetical protein
MSLDGIVQEITGFSRLFGLDWTEGEDIRKGQVERKLSIYTPRL